MARTPEKLEDMLKKRGFSPALLDAKLVVVKGNAKDPEASKKAVVDGNGRMVDQIVFGIGEALLSRLATIKALTD